MARPNNIANLDNLLQEYRDTVSSKAEEIDPSNEQDWYSMCLGWGLAKGLSVEQAHSFALHVSYDLNDMV